MRVHVAQLSHIGRVLGGGKVASYLKDGANETENRTKKITKALGHFCK
jgi:hypothetical protein